jgi:hypothetical protein
MRPGICSDTATIAPLTSNALCVDVGMTCQ